MKFYECKIITKNLVIQGFWKKIMVITVFLTNFYKKCDADAYKQPKVYVLKGATA